MRDAVGRLSRPVPLEREQAMGLAERRLVARFGSRCDRALRAGGRAALVAETAVHVRQPERVRAAERSIVEPREPGFVRNKHVDALAEAAQKVQRMGVAKGDVQHAAVTLVAFRHALQTPGREIEVKDGLRVRIHTGRAFRRPKQPRHRFVDQIGARIVIGERRRHLVETIAVQLLERPRRLQVELAPAARQQAVVGHVLGQRMLEDEHRLIAAGALVHELLAAELGQRRIQIAALRQPLEQAARHFAANHRRRLQQLLGRVGQAIEAGHDHALHGVRNRLIAGALLDDRPRELLEEERVALATLQDGGRHLGREALIAGHRPEQLARSRRR